MAACTSTKATKSSSERMQRVQSVLLIWLDGSIDKNKDDCKKTIAQLRRVVNDLNTYTDTDRCTEFIRTIENNKICVVVSGSLGEHFVPRAHDLSQMDSIFVFCGNKKRHDQWAKDWPKVRGVFTEIKPICEALRQAAQRCEHNATSMSFVPPDADLDRLQPSFMYTQILKEILLTIDFDQQHFQDFIDFCCQKFATNEKELRYIESMRVDYGKHTPIWWYTSDCFLYRMLNHALRVLDGDILVRLGFFINDLHRHIERVYTKQRRDRSSSASVQVYRGQAMSKDEFEQLSRSRNGLVSFDCFLSTSTDPAVSERFLELATVNPGVIGISFVIKLDPAQSTTPFAYIEELTAIEGEKEVLFAMHSVFRIHEIQAKDGSKRRYTVRLSLTKDDDEQLRKLTNHIREEIPPNGRPWERLASVLYNMGQLGKAEEIYRTLLRQATSESEKATIYNQLGLLKDEQGSHDEAVQLLKRSIEIERKQSSPNQKNLANSYTNIAGVYQSMGDYQNSLDAYERALSIKRRILPPDHPSFAVSYNNMGIAHRRMKSYSNALECYEAALAIRQKSLPPNHPELATSYANIGEMHYSMGAYGEALSFFEKDLTISQKSLPSTHPNLAETYSNIGSAHEGLRDYPKAYSFYERAEQIGRKSLPTNHPNLKSYQDDLERIRRKL